MSIWSKFTSWLSGWPESKHRRSEREQIYLFEEEEQMIRKNNKNIGKAVGKKVKGLNPKKKQGKKQGNIQ